jgi:hypothetical protein
MLQQVLGAKRDVQVHLLAQLAGDAPLPQREGQPVPELAECHED